MKNLRDISIAFLNSLNLKNPTLLDSTAATGVRAIRYAKESSIKRITVLDMNKKAADNARLNLAKNKVKAKVLNLSIQDFASSCSDTFDIIDLDPFGSPAPLIYDVLRLSGDGTILMVTATDTAVLCGAHSAACVKQYGSLPLHNELCKEAGIRILINYLIRKAAEFNLGVKVNMSISDMHYMRVFVTLERGAEKAYTSMLQTGFGAYCNNCSSFDFSVGIAPKVNQTCKNCKKGMKLFGPLYLGKLNDKSLLSRILHKNLGTEAEKTVKLIFDEYDVPFFYSMPRITGNLGISSAPFDSISSKLRKSGYSVSRTQFDKDGFKTNAPLAELIKAIKKSKAEQR